MPTSRPPAAAKNPLLALLAWNWLAGAAVAVILVAAVIGFDVARLRSLIVASDEPWIPVLLLFFGFLITMCSVTMGTAVMALGAEPKDDGPDRGTRAPTGEPALATVAARPRR